MYYGDSVDFADKRMMICKACPHYGSIVKVCKLCGCFLPAKTKMKSKGCPDDPPRWTAINSDINNSNCCNKGNQ